ncbi:tyrosine-type recombinase/integrase [Actinoplanes sp. NPDC026670]|uniref:tyrosine-type recombinase/integrase n=1 Tax=Actinoplanes sp. NPDC026670 TaxID=3154700 RepID=UPI0033FB804A
MYVEVRQHQVDSDQVYTAIDPDSPRAPAQKQTPLLRDWIERWVRLKVDVRSTTHAEYARLLRCRVVRDLGDLRVGDITRYDHLDPWKAALSRELAPASVGKHWRVLSMVMRDAVPRWRDDNPLSCPAGQHGNGLPRPEPYEAAFLSAEQARILLDHCGPQLQALVLAALGTGLRLGELLGLRAKDIDLNQTRPTVRVQRVLQTDGVLGVPKTPQSRRTVTLTRSMALLFAYLTQDKAAEERVFTNADGKPWNAGNLRQRYWRPAVAAAQRCVLHPPAASPSGWVSATAVSSCRCATRLQARPRFHDLRHSHVAYLIAAGWDLYLIQLRLGHASIRTTFDTYGHLLPHGEQDQLAALQRVLP